MNLKKIILLPTFFIILTSCADYKSIKINKKVEKKYYSSSGFALVYASDLYDQKVINKKINNNNIVFMHNTLKVNTSIKITNPINSKVVVAMVNKKIDYPKIFNSVISLKLANLLELDLNNPLIEVTEVKKNKTFVAKKSNTFDEEKNVAGKAPVDDIMMDDLTQKKNKKKKKQSKKYNFILVINDFYYENSALNLKNDIKKKTNLKNISIKKMNNKYRLLVGPFKNFNALKTTYISLNKLGFDDLNIFRN